MRRNDHFHLTESQYVTNANLLYAKYRDANKITESDEIAIREFVSSLAGTISGSRFYKLVNTLLLCREFFPDYMGCSTRDVKDGINKIRFARDDKDQPRFKVNTINDRIKMMRRFFLWLVDEAKKAKIAKQNDEYHWMLDFDYLPRLNKDEIENIKPPRPDKMTKTKSDLFTEEDIKKLINAASCTRDRALISTLYESGCRGIEIGSLTWSQVEFTPWGVCLNVDGKTGEARHIPLVVSRKYLVSWREDAKNADDKDGYVFHTLRSVYQDGEYVYKPLSYCIIKKMLVKTAESAGIPAWKCKKIHTFRHSRCTHLIEHDVSETAIKKMMWSNLNSREFSTYCHLVSKDIDTAIARANGISIEDEESKNNRPLQLQQCPVCHQMNSPTAEYCEHCATPLGEAAKNDVTTRQRELDEMLSDPAALIQIMDILRSKTNAEKGGRR